MALQPGSSLLHVCLGADLNSLWSNNGTHYHPLDQHALAGTPTTEAHAQVKMRGAATLSKLGVLVSSNSRAGTTTVRTRINGGNGNQVLSIGAGATGFFEDASNTDTIADGDLVCLSVNLAGGNAQTLIFKEMHCQMTMASGNAVQYFGVFGASNLYNSALTTAAYMALCGRDGQTGSESDIARPQVPCAGTFSSLQVYVDANARSTDTHVYLRVNGSDTALDITIGAGATGLFEDTSNTVTIAQDDRAGYKIAPGSGSGTLSIERIGVRFIGADDESPMISTGSENAWSGTGYVQFGGCTTNGSFVSASETNVGLNVPFDCYIKDLSVYGNSMSTTGDVVARVNGADSALALSWTGAASQTEEHTIVVPISAGDDLNFEITPSATSNVQHFSMVLSNEDHLYDSNSASNDPPPVALGVRQWVEGSGSFSDVLVTLGSTPVEGNLLIAFCKFFIGGGINTTDWTVLDEQTGQEPQFHIAYRYVESGDTTAVPEISATNGGFWRVLVIEVEGASLTGVAGADIVAYSVSATATGAGTAEDTTVTPELDTTETNQLSLGAFFSTSNATVVDEPVGDYTTLINEDSTTDVTNSSMIWGGWDIVASIGGAPLTVHNTAGSGSQWKSIQQVIIASGEVAPPEDSNSQDSNSNSDDAPVVGARRTLVIVL